MSASILTRQLGCVLVTAGFCGMHSIAVAAGKQPTVAERAPEFELKDVNGQQAKLSDLVSGGPVVLVVLRGYPGYQCPICTQQFGELLGKAQDFDTAGAKVVLVYPGDAKDLDKHAKEFIGGKRFPNNFRFLLDPDYKFTSAYGLRWEAPNETAYPASFVIGKDGKITFARVSRGHGGRVPAEDLVKEVQSQK